MTRLRLLSPSAARRLIRRNAKRRGTDEGLWIKLYALGTCDCGWCFFDKSPGYVDTTAYPVTHCVKWIPDDARGGCPKVYFKHPENVRFYVDVSTLDEVIYQNFYKRRRWQKDKKRGLRGIIYSRRYRRTA